MMGGSGTSDVLIGLAKIVGGVIRDSIDIGDYRLTIMVEKKVDNNTGIIIDSLSVDRKMSALEAGIIAKKLRNIIEKP